MAEPVDTLDTIVAISTPPGRGGIGIVRLSGPRAVEIAARLLRGAGRLDDPEAHGRARFARVVDPAASGSAEPATIDEAVVTVFHGPRSYTGEDLVEIAAHGAPVVLEAIVASALGAGAEGGDAGPVRLAGPGEFTQRAFLSGRLDLTQAEAVHDLIAAQTLDQARVAARQMGGALSRRVAPAKEALLHLMAFLEAGMDFASGELDDVDVVPPEQIAAEIAEARGPLAALAASFACGQILRRGAAIAIVGPANAGKSSLFNRLLERERAIVTPLPGTTRDTVEETLALGGIPLRLIDTAGLRELGAAGGAAEVAGTEGEAALDKLDAAERQGIARSLEALADADLVLLVHDATQPLTAAERELAASLSGRPHLMVENKLDLLASADDFSDSLKQRQTQIPSGDDNKKSDLVIRVSALTGAGLDGLRGAMLRELRAEGALAAEGALNNLRQQQAVLAAIQALDAAAAANASGLPHEVLLMDLHAALGALDSLTGATTADDILALIFSAFCIGK